MLLLTLMLSAGCAEKDSGAPVGANVVTVEQNASETAGTTAVPTPAPTVTPEPTEAPTEDPGAIRIIGEDELNAILARSVYSSEEQKVFVESALSLVGKVSYFWGGKSYHIGFDPDWGKLRKVTCTGDSTTGQTLPYGLDCSGFICWCGAQLGKGVKWTSTNIGEGSWYQWNNSVEVDRDKLRPGDIAFQNPYPGAETQHVGIVVGFLENGDPVIVHCSCTENAVVVSTAGETFNIFRRLNFLNG